MAALEDRRAQQVAQQGGTHGTYGRAQVEYSDNASLRNPELRSQLIRSSSTLPAADTIAEAQDSTDI